MADGTDGGGEARLDRRLLECADRTPDGAPGMRGVPVLSAEVALLLLLLPGRVTERTDTMRRLMGGGGASKDTTSMSSSSLGGPSRPPGLDMAGMWTGGARFVALYQRRHHKIDPIEDTQPRER